jgi:hypothetical protein
MPASDLRLFQIVPLAAGERPSPNAIAHGGGLDLILAHLNGRADLDVAIARAAAAEARAEAAIRDHNEAVAAIIDEVSKRLGDFEAGMVGLRKSAAERRDLDAETAGLQRYALPPEESPAVAADTPDPSVAEETHGELTTHPPSHPHDKEQLQLDTATGVTPRELQRNVPPIGGSGTEPELDPGHPRVPKYRAPAALSLN